MIIDSKLSQHPCSRRLSLDDGEDLESFIASDEEEEEGGWASEGGEDWRAALREATGG